MSNVAKLLPLVGTLERYSKRDMRGDSHPVISGFTSAAALIIGFSQLEHVLGFNIARSHHVQDIVIPAVSGIHQTSIITLAIAVSGIVALGGLKRYSPLFPRALLVVGASSAAVWALHLEDRGVAIVGQVPNGLPTPALPAVDWQAARTLLPMALTIALVGFMESIAVAKRYARENQYPVDANRELVGLGLANVVGALSGSYPVTGGFSRTAVNAQAGARTTLAGILTAVVVGVTLLWLTPLFYHLPNAVLAVIIITAVVGLIDVAEVEHLWHVKRADLSMLLLTFASTLALGIEQGIVVGVVASLAMLIFHSTMPHVAVLGRLPGTEVYRNVKRHPQAQTAPGVLALRLDAQVYFGNVNFLKETLDTLEREADEQLHAVVTDASGINQLDASGETALREIFEGYSPRGIELLLSNVKGPVRDVLERSGLMTALGNERTFLSTGDAMRRARSLATERSDAGARPALDGAGAELAASSGTDARN